MDNNLLTDPILRVDTTSGSRKRLSLPGVMADLMQGEIISFAALQAHQNHAWHAFLVQLAAMALHRADQATPPVEEKKWREMLRHLTLDWSWDEPWRLVVEDLGKPAFMQPPVPENSLKGFKNQYAQPDQIDVLVTAKNHDIKMARIDHPQPDNWIMALVSLQTMEGFMGAGNYGIARMNGGFASRPGVGIRPDPLWGSHFRQDLTVLRQDRDALLERYPDFYQKKDGAALLWLLPWDGLTSLSLADLDPYFIEICRRVRFSSGPKGPLAHISTSKATRILAKDFKGVLGDPWTPIRTDKEETSLTVTGKGFDYDLAARLLLGDGGYRFSPAQIQGIHVQQGQGEFYARALARGQGVSEGYHERRIPIPTRVKAILSQPDKRASLAALATQRVDQSGIMANKVLKPALLTMIQEAPDKLNFKDRRADPWLMDLDHQVDDEFFPSLWRTLENSREEAEIDWLSFLRKTSQAIMASANNALIGGGARRYKTITAAERTFYGALFKNFAVLRKNEGQTNAE
ncbi:MAG: type I-E CRISPR-associated protein Cse1/CasA [Magnetococcales bacterium]|nr:type I-E CRISPR-associated protein Cse1/CasA [Magnetococcales bacterium]